MTTFWRTFHHDGKISPAWCGWGCTPTPIHYIYHHVQNCSVRTLQLRAQKNDPYFYSTLYVLCEELAYSDKGQLGVRWVRGALR